MEKGSSSTNGLLPATANPTPNPITIINQGTGLFAPYHQHIFCARFDMALDGVHNRIKEVDSHPCPKGKWCALVLGCLLIADPKPPNPQHPPPNQSGGTDAHTKYQTHPLNPTKSPPSSTGPENPHDSAWITHETLLRTELEARRDADLHKERFWLVESSQAKNRTGKVGGWIGMCVGV